jgi:hypothetical protein
MQAPLLTDERPYALVVFEDGLSPRDIGRIYGAIALLRGVRGVHNAERLVIGMPPDLRAVVTGEPTAAVLQRRVRRKVTLGG